MKPTNINMKFPTLLFVWCITIIFTVVQAQDDNIGGQFCPIPTAGCQNGMFSQTKCHCECRQPFCPDDFGTCTQKQSGCTENPWANCSPGIDCPWYIRSGGGDKCYTDNDIPPGIYDLYNTQGACCAFNFPYSEMCTITEEGPPTKHPTIVAPDDDDFEVIPIKFEVMGLPLGITKREIKDEMTTVLKRILLRLADKIEELRISEVEEKVMTPTPNRGLLKKIRTKDKQHKQTQQQQEQYLRELQSSPSLSFVELYFNVHVVRVKNKKFGPLLIDEMMRSYDEILEQVQSFADTQYFGGELKMNWCTIKNGKYELCVFAKDTSDSSSTDGKGSVNGSSSGLESWAIALIVIIVLFVVGCAGYWIAVIYFGVPNCFKYYDEYNTKSNVYWDDDIDNRSRATGHTPSRSRRPPNDDVLMLTNGRPSRRNDQKMLALTNGSEHSRNFLALENGSSHRRPEMFALENGPSRDAAKRSDKLRRENERLRQENLLLENERLHQKQLLMENERLREDNDQILAIMPSTSGRGSRDNNRGRRNAQSRDPPIYLDDDHSDKPDPDADLEVVTNDVLMITDGGGGGGDKSRSKRRNKSRRYYEDDSVPSAKPKRDPTMYINGVASIDGESQPYSVFSSSNADTKSDDKGARERIYADEDEDDGFGENVIKEQLRRTSGVNSIDEGYIDHYNMESFPPRRASIAMESYDIEDVSQPSFVTDEPSFATRSVASSRPKDRKKCKKTSRRYE